MKMCVSILSSALKSEDIFFRQNFYFILEAERRKKKEKVPPVPGGNKKALGLQRSRTFDQPEISPSTSVDTSLASRQDMRSRYFDPKKNPDFFKLLYTMMTHIFMIRISSPGKKS